MFIAKAIYSILPDTSERPDVRPYFKNVSPSNYDFSLNVGGDYLVFGLLTMDCLPYIYAKPLSGRDTLSVFPSVLFDLRHFKVVREMSGRLSSSDFSDFELVPKELASIDDWFEKYLEDDKDVVELIAKLEKSFLLSV